MENNIFDGSNGISPIGQVCLTCLLNEWMTLEEVPAIVQPEIEHYYPLLTKKEIPVEQPAPGGDEEIIY